MPACKTQNSLHRPTHESSRIKWVQYWLLETTGLAELRAVAGQLGISGTALTLVISGARRTPGIQKRIADLVGLKPLDLFGPHTHWSLTDRQQTRITRRKAG